MLLANRTVASHVAKIKFKKNQFPFRTASTIHRIKKNSPPLLNLQKIRTLISIHKTPEGICRFF